jgi:hypothetical protein
MDAIMDKPEAEAFEIIMSNVLYYNILLTADLDKF